MFFLKSYRQSYIAIIGDIKQSRQIEKRDCLQKKLDLALDSINQKYKSDIAAKFLITLGDEFQGLLTNGENVMRMLQEIERQLYPVKVRFGLGIGGITTEINPNMALGADGPAFYKAREAIEYLKENETKKRAVESSIRIAATEDEEQIMLLNTTLSLLEAIKEEWTDRQRETIWNMMEFQDGQAQVAGRLGVLQPTVQKALAKGKYYAYEDAVDVIGMILGGIKYEYD